MHLDPEQGGDAGMYHDVQITLCLVRQTEMSTVTDGLIGSMLCLGEPLQETLATI